jgi:outer membrane protein OmpA-like peptidoglycan-associated protein
MMKSPHLVKRLLGACALALSVAVPTAALAQEVLDDGLDAHGFHLAAFDGDPRDLLEVYRPGRQHAWEFYASGLFEYAKAPLSFESGPIGQTSTSAALDNLLAANLVAGITPHERVRVDVAWPLYILSTGPGGEVEGTAPGDLRASAMIGLLLPEDTVAGGVGLGIVPWIDLPTGADERWLGQRSVAGGAAAAATLELEQLTLSGHFGMQWNPEVEAYNLTGTDTLVGGFGAGWLFDRAMGMSLEAVLAPPLTPNARAGTAFPAEALLSFRRRWESGPHLTVGVGAALSRGAGAAPFRAFIGGGFGRIEVPVPPDLDGDGIPNSDDDCPENPESANGWRDEDGCPDDLGAISVWGEYEENPKELSAVTVTLPDGPRVLDPTHPQVVGVLPGTEVQVQAMAGTCLGGSAKAEAYEGNRDVVVMLSRNLEGALHFKVTTLDDEQPIPGATVQVQSALPECAPQTSSLQLGDEGTGSVAVGAGEHLVIVDVPQYALYRNKVFVKAGSTEEVIVSLKKTRTRVTAQRIEIFEMVHFELDKAVILPESFSLLDEVAEQVKTHPQIKLVEVAGHTDDQGSASYNLGLSQARAEAVAAYLTGKGVAPERVRAKGYGETRTIDTNETEEGRAHNRRVEFNILEQDTVFVEE